MEVLSTVAEVSYLQNLAYFYITGAMRATLTAALEILLDQSPFDEFIESEAILLKDSHRKHKDHSRGHPHIKLLTESYVQTTM